MLEAALILFIVIVVALLAIKAVGCLVRGLLFGAALLLLGYLSLVVFDDAILAWAHGTPAPQVVPPK